MSLSPVRSLPVIVHDFWKFGVVGAISTIIDFGVLNLAVDQHLNVYWAIFLAYALASVNGYLLNHHWTYRRLGRKVEWRRFGQFAIVNGVGLLVTELIVYSLTRSVHWSLNIEKAIAVIVVFLWSFTANRRWTFDVRSAVEA